MTTLIGTYVYLFLYRYTGITGAIYRPNEPNTGIKMRGTLTRFMWSIFSSTTVSRVILYINPGGGEERDPCVVDKYWCVGIDVTERLTGLDGLLWKHYCILYYWRQFSFQKIEIDLISICPYFDWQKRPNHSVKIPIISKLSMYSVWLRLISIIFWECVKLCRPAVYGKKIRPICLFCFLANYCLQAISLIFKGWLWRPDFHGRKTCFEPNLVLKQPNMNRQ